MNRKEEFRKQVESNVLVERRETECIINAVCSIKIQVDDAEKRLKTAIENEHWRRAAELESYASGLKQAFLAVEFLLPNEFLTRLGTKKHRQEKSKMMDDDYDGF